MKSLFITFLVVFIFVLGCKKSLGPKIPTPVPDAEAVGVYHTVKKGENLTSICHIYQADLQEVAEMNGIDNPNQLLIGQEIFIPDVKGPVEKVTQQVKTEKPSQTIKQWSGDFSWPVIGVVTSKFGIRNGRRHDGIDISAPEGTPIIAAALGAVLFSGNQNTGYGNLIILQHQKDMITVYAHNQKNIVKEDEKVKQGQVIGYVGKTGSASGPHLHFEIREKTKPRNPMFFLPKLP